MKRDLRDVVNKIIVPVSNDGPTTDEIADLAADLAAFFDASVALVYFGKLPVTMPPGPSQVGSAEVTAAAMNAVEDGGNMVLARMASEMAAQGVEVTSRFIMGSDGHALRDIIEQERGDLVVLPKWETGLASRLARVLAPSILEEATCPVLVLKGNRWQTISRSPRPSRTANSAGSVG